METTKLRQAIDKYRGNPSGEWMPALIASLQESISKTLLDKIEGEIRTEVKGIVQEIMKKAISSESAKFKGLKGDKGLDGKNGKNGEKGDPGKDAKPGRDGKDGKDGIGIAGKDGKNGKDGSPDTPNQIAEKLNTLEQRVDMSVIKGLTSTLSSLRNTLREKGGGGGGGMGNIQHEQFPLTSATTSVNLRNPIAGGGFAVFAFYQGQDISRGTQYTVSSNRKTLTLTFQPDNSTELEVIYFRG